MKKLGLVFGLIFLFFPCLSFASVSGEINSSSTYYNVGGKTENSFYEPESLEYLWEMFFNLEEEIFGNWRLRSSLNLRATDDRLVDPQDFSMERFFVEFSNRGSSFTLGDFAVNFSSFTVNNSLKGLKTSFDFGENLKFTAVAGANFYLWEDLCEERTDDTQLRQYIGGLRLEQTLGSIGNLGLNFGILDDDDSFVSSYSDPQRTTVVSLDTRLNLFRDLNIEAEFAISWYDKNTDSKDTPRKTDHGLRFLADYRIGRFFFRGGFEREGSNFSSVGGFTTQDFEEFFQEIEIDLFKDSRLRLTYRQNRDNLDKHKATTTRQRSPGINLTFKPFRNTMMDLGCDLTRRDASDDSVEELYRRAFIRLNQAIGPANLSLEYTNTRIDNNIDNTLERLTDYVILAFDTSFSFKDVNFSPSLEYEISHEEYRSISESDLTQAIGLGLRLTFPKGWEVNSKVRLSSFDSYQADADQNNTRYEFNLLKRFGQHYEFSLNYQHSGYGYETSEENYNETIVSVKLNLRF